MSTEKGNLIRLEKADLPRARDVLVSAFIDYPLLRYFYPEEPAREKIARQFLSLALFSGLRYGEIYATSSDFEGVAVWWPSEHYPPTLLQFLLCVPLTVYFNFARFGGMKIKKLFDFLDEMHRRVAPFPHLYLEVIGVAPLYQGKGYAGRLVRPVLARADETHLPCYLETLDEKNVAIYEHFGFEPIEKVRVPGTELIGWAMVRQPNPD